MLDQSIFYVPELQMNCLLLLVCPAVTFLHDGRPSGNYESLNGDQKEVLAPGLLSSVTLNPLFTPSPYDLELTLDFPEPLLFLLLFE